MQQTCQIIMQEGVVPLTPEALTMCEGLEASREHLQSKSCVCQTGPNMDGVLL